MERNGQDPRPTLSVSQLNECIKATLESAPPLRDVYVQGELSGVRLYASGHLYFSLKDENSAIGGVMFARQVSTLRFTPENGMRVILHGRVSVYAVRGQYQLVADALVPVGAGDLAVAFEQLKAKLGAEGLFDSARKKPLPPYPRRIGVITSPSGAAIHDIIRVARGRMPSVEILLFPSEVQGARASRYLAGGVRYFNSPAVRSDPEQAVDVIILGRGGGSTEDLWCFNDEGLARVIAASEIPIISAVGHEVDFSISDFVADRRAATPSAAAEMATPDRADLGRRVRGLSDRLDNALDGRLARERDRIAGLAARRVLTAPEGAVQRRRELLKPTAQRLERAMRHGLDVRGRELRRLCAQMQALSPLAVLGRGYALVRTPDGRLIPRAAGLAPDAAVAVQFADGTAHARVERVEIQNTDMAPDGADREADV